MEEMFIMEKHHVTKSDYNTANASNFLIWQWTKNRKLLGTYHGQTEKTRQGVYSTDEVARYWLFRASHFQHYHVNLAQSHCSKYCHTISFPRCFIQSMSRWSFCVFCRCKVSLKHQLSFKTRSVNVLSIS